MAATISPAIAADFSNRPLTRRTSLEREPMELVLVAVIVSEAPRAHRHDGKREPDFASGVFVSTMASTIKTQSGLQCGQMRWFFFLRLVRVLALTAYKRLTVELSPLRESRYFHAA